MLQDAVTMLADSLRSLLTSACPSPVGTCSDHLCWTSLCCSQHRKPIGTSVEAPDASRHIPPTPWRGRCVSNECIFRSYDQRLYTHRTGSHIDLTLCLPSACCHAAAAIHALDSEYTARAEHSFGSVNSKLHDVVMQLCMCCQAVCIPSAALVTLTTV
jgi:hypothetical protein